MNDLDLGFTEDPRPRGRRQAGRRRKKERRRRRRGRIAALVSLFVVIAVLGGVALGGYTVYQKMTFVPDYAGSGTGEATVHVLPGDVPPAIGRKLEKLGVVKSSKAFVKAAEANTDSTKIQPGYYLLKKRMKASLALERLLDPKAKVQWVVTVREGLRAKAVFEQLSQKTEIPVADFKKAAKETEEIGLPADAKGQIEGYLFPATYELPPKSTATSILRTMINRYKQEEAESDLVAKADARNMSPHQVLTIASLLEAESREADFSKVSRVVYNRVQKGMPLQFDSTILYALGRADLHVTHKDLRVDSPYNTYTHKGLPPGPIGNPGAKAIEAALNPAAGNWLYFVTTDPSTGETKFTDSPTEFAKFKQEFKRNRDKQEGSGG